MNGHSLGPVGANAPCETRETEQVLNRITVLADRIKAADIMLGETESRLMGGYPDVDAACSGMEATSSSMFGQMHQALDRMERIVSELSERAHRINRL